MATGFSKRMKNFFSKVNGIKEQDGRLKAQGY
jgi:hypothetical protein